MSKLFSTLLALTALSTAAAQTPLLDHVYAADPSAHVWEDDPNTLWLYTSHDEPGTNTHKTMFSYHAFSTTNLVDWVDHGRIFSVDDASSWASTMAWATDAVYWNDKYYLVHCMKERSTGVTRTGLAVSDYPQGPFIDAGYIRGVDGGQDPALFVDDDRRAYLYWGSGGKCYGVELHDDLRSTKEWTMTTLTEQLFEVFEGPWVHKYNGKYYLSYPGLPENKWPEQMYYATADKPLGPYKFEKIYIPNFEHYSGTNHGSIIEWKGKWIAFHHSAHLSGGNSTCRSLLADWLTYDKNGVINTIERPEGLGLAERSNVTIKLEAENAERQGGKLDGTYVAYRKEGFTGNGYVTGFETDFNYVQVIAQVARKMRGDLRIRIAADKDFHADIFVGNRVLNNEWNGMLVKADGEWQELLFEGVELLPGDNIIKIQSYDDVNLKVDNFEIKL